jgi:cyclic pyranopterin phosphate synthase
VRPGIFKRITGVDALDEVKRGVIAASESHLNPITLNMVVLNGLNADEVPEMIEFSRRMGAILQLIEFQPLQLGAENWGGFHYDLRPVENTLEDRSERVYERPLHRRRRYHLKGGGVVEVVRPMHNSRFCGSCTRLRVTSDGRLKPCLMREDNLVEAVSLIRRGSHRREIADAFREAVAMRAPYWGD